MAASTIKQTYASEIRTTLSASTNYTVELNGQTHYNFLLIANNLYDSTKYEVCMLQKMNNGNVNVHKIVGVDLITGASLSGNTLSFTGASEYLRCSLIQC